jgi:hypothetical protein
MDVPVDGVADAVSGVIDPAYKQWLPVFNIFETSDKQSHVSRAFL